jgi:hypothetical protein
VRGGKEEEEKEEKEEEEDETGVGLKRQTYVD